jgi:hypothetical protein
MLRPEVRRLSSLLQRWSRVHERLDVEHTEAERAMIAAHAAGHEAAIGLAVRAAVDATDTRRDGVERLRH